MQISRKFAQRESCSQQLHELDMYRSIEYRSRLYLGVGIMKESTLGFGTSICPRSSSPSSPLKGMESLGMLENARVWF